MATARSEAASLRLLWRLSGTGTGRLCSAPRRLAISSSSAQLGALNHTRDLSSTSSASRTPIAARSQPKQRSVPKSATPPAVQSVPSEPKREIAILGGGLTGLTAAHYLARHAPDAQITLFEAGTGLGGWVHGAVEDTPQGKVVMQSGPRMIRSAKTANRYDDLVFYDVLANLKIQDELKDVGEAASARYIYYPDHLVRLPGPPFTLPNIVDSVRSILTEPLWDGAIKAGFNFARPHEGKTASTRGLSREHMNDDESVGHFLERIIGDDRPVKNIVSAMMHGIYGGDAYKLSAKHTMFARLWYNEVAGPRPGFTWAAYKELSLLADIMDGPNRRAVVEMAARSVDRNMLSFDDGMLTLIRALESDLKQFNNVRIKMQTPVVGLKADTNGKVLLESKDSSGQVKKRFDKVISTITAKQLSKLASPAGSLEALESTEAVTIHVVTLWYPEHGLLSGNPGFGYLVPVSAPDNDAGILGVIFDSEAQTSVDEPGTKLTVMMGGHHWDGNTFFPTEEQAVEMAIEAVTKSLGIPRMPGMRTRSRLCRDCLPQHHVGHRDLMARAHDEILDAFGSGLAVAGPSYTPAGIMPSMRSGFEIAMRVARQTPQPWFGEERDNEERWWEKLPPITTESTGIDVFRHDHIGETGLEGFLQPESDMVDRVGSDALWFRTASRGFDLESLDKNGVPTKLVGSSLKSGTSAP